MHTFTSTVSRLNDLVWGPPLIGLLLCTGLYLVVRTRAVPLRYILYAHRLAFSGKSQERSDKQPGDISRVQGLMTILASSIGIGNITGVATAIALGGPGALFWLWIAALCGMATKYGEAVLALRYRDRGARGTMSGGPMYYLEKGLKCKWLGVFFALFGMIAMAVDNMVQANSVASALSAKVPLSPFWVGCALMIVVGIVLLGGIKNTGRVVTVLVPVMVVVYLLGTISFIVTRYVFIPETFVLIVKSAFCKSAGFGGIAGATVLRAVELGISHGVFSTEAGLGTSPMTAAAIKTDMPARQALLSVYSVVITGVVCTFTGLTVVLSSLTNAPHSTSLSKDASSLVSDAFDAVLPGGGWIVTITLIPFAYSTILVWAYCGEKCAEYLMGSKAVTPYRILSSLLMVLGAVLQWQIAWGTATFMNSMMVLPNLIALIALSGAIRRETCKFLHSVQ